MVLSAPVRDVLFTPSAFWVIESRLNVSSSSVEVLPVPTLNVKLVVEDVAESANTMAPIAFTATPRVSVSENAVWTVNEISNVSVPSVSAAVTAPVADRSTPATE